MFKICSLLAGGSALLIASTAMAGAFTSGDLVIYRVGNGDTLANTGNNVYLDEYTPAGALVQSIALPTTASGSNNALFSPGNSSSEGMITRSTDGRYLMVTGYAAESSGALTSTTADVVPRVIGRVDAQANIDTSTTITDPAVTKNFRSAVSTNGTDIWFTGGSDAGTGVRYTIFGTSGSGTKITTDGGDYRQVNIFGGQLYLSTASSSNTLNTVGTGLPTAAGQSLAALNGVATKPYQFFLADLSPDVAGVDTLYYAEDAGGAGIRKYSLVGDTWTLNGTISVNPSDTTSGNNLRGLVGSVAADGKTVDIFATQGSTSNTGSGNLYGLVDTGGYNAAPSSTLANSLVAITGTGSFRGIAFAPTDSAVPEPASIGILVIGGLGLLARRRK